MIGELYAKFYQELLNWCRTLTKDHSGAEDLVQETFLRAVGHQEELYDLEERQRRAWLYQTARRVRIDQVRKTSREAELTQAVLDTALTEEDLTRPETAQLVGRLPKEERALFSLRYFAGYNAAELGEMFSLPPSTVRSRLRSARRRIQTWLEE